MNIILTGATGFVGTEVLDQLLADPAIGRVTCLSRRPPPLQSPRLDTILHEDFTSYPAALLERLAAHDACIWALGGKASDLGHPDEFIRITHAFTLALASGIAARARRPFAFCYLSGMGADQDESAWLPWEKLTRHIKGRTERDLLALQRHFPGFSVHCYRPGGILPRGAGVVARTLLAPIAVGVDTLADALIAGAADPGLAGSLGVISNHGIKRLAGRRSATRQD
jgi:nucleoside-diphosphate-sugar epimerase